MNNLYPIKLEEIIITRKGKKPSDLGNFSEKKTTPYIDIKAFEYGDIRQYCSGEGVVLCDEDNVLMVWDGSRSGLVGIGSKGAVGSTIALLEVPLINSKYLYYFLQSKFVYLNTNTRGVGIPHVDPIFLGNLLFPLTSIRQQFKVVEKVEELFSHIDAGVEGLKQAKVKLQRYRQSVLKDAVTGKLTENWREKNTEQLALTDKLLERILAERRANWEQEQLKAFAKRNVLPKDDKWKERYAVIEGVLPSQIEDFLALPDGWSYAKLGQLIEDPGYGTSKKCSYVPKGKGVLRIPNIIAGEVDSNDMKFAEFTDDEIESYRLNRGDILIIRSNGSVSLVGKCAVITDKDVDYLFAGYLIRLRPVLKFVDPYYLKFALNSGFLRKQIEALAKSSSGVNNINSGELQSLIIPICSLEEQKYIAQEIDAKNMLAIRQLEQYNILLKQAENNKSSILSKAFSGELLENVITDETAEHLLGKIYAEKQHLEQREKFTKKKSTTGAKRMEKRSIIDVLKESKKALKVEEIFELAGFQNDVSPEGVEAFYQELKTASEHESINVTSFFLENIRQGDKFEYKESSR